jgi:hypothetical protein
VPDILLGWKGFEMNTEFCWGKLVENNHLEDQEGDEKMTLACISEEYDWRGTEMARYHVQLWALI